jgi:YHS domain-containing protein
MRVLNHVTWIRVFLSIVLSASFAVPMAAASEKAAVPAVNAASGIGVKGYDPVAYFTAGRPTPGLEQYTYRLKGVTYRFASAEDREEFKAAPEKYLPRYGGYCAYAMSLDRIADIDPSRWEIVNHKLYLNNNYLSFHLWSLDKDRNIASANRNWPSYPKQPEGE